MHGSAVPGARGCVWDCAPSPGCGSPQGPGWVCAERRWLTRLSRLSDPREGGWSGGSWGSPPQSVGAAWWRRVLEGKALGL